MASEAGAANNVWAGEPAVFVDRDGTLCEHVPYLDEPSEVRLLPTVADGVRRLNDAGVPVIVVTNQSGIGRGYFSERTMHRVNARLLYQLADRNASVRDLYYCPHHPDDGCACRKPEPGLIERAAADHALDPTRSYLLGDRASDVAAGRRAGCTPILFPSPETDEAVRRGERDTRAARRVATFAEAVDSVLDDPALGGEPEGSESSSETHPPTEGS